MTNHQHYPTPYSLFAYYAHGCRELFNYAGRESRTSFWSYFLIQLILLFFLHDAAQYAIKVQGQPLFPTIEIIHSYFFCLWGTGMLLHQLIFLAYSIRRLHDAGYSGWWFLTCNIATYPVFLLLCLRPSQQEANPYAPAVY